MGFYYEHDIEFHLASHEQRAHLLEYQQEVVSEDPLEIRTTIPLGGNELQLTFDEEMTVIDVSR